MLMASSQNVKLMVRDLGRLRYADAFTLQKQAQEEVIATRHDQDGAMQLLLVEHDPPVVTISRRPGAAKHLVASDQQLRSAGVEVAETDRGGDITYHGPGQLVVYPILDLNRLNLRLNSYLRFLEQIIIDVLAEFEIHGQRDDCATGVWVQSNDHSRPHGFSEAVCNADRPTSKIAAIGVRVSRWVSMHGLALNVTTNLDHFNLIVPCGLAGRTVTSMQRELGERCPAMTEVKDSMKRRFINHLQEKTRSTCEALLCHETS
jgi:lipoyl(octanoyl) transferase